MPLPSMIDFTSGDPWINSHQPQPLRVDFNVKQTNPPYNPILVTTIGKKFEHTSGIVFLCGAMSFQGTLYRAEKKEIIGPMMTAIHA